MSRGSEDDRSWEEVKRELDVDPEETAALGRLGGAEEALYRVWEERGEPMNWVGETLSFPVMVEDEGLWLFELGKKVAALGGHLELHAVFPDQTVTLLREPGP